MIRRQHLAVCGALACVALMMAACVRGAAPQDYIIDVHGALVDGSQDRPIEGAHVIVKAGDKVIYDGFTDEAGKLAFTYRTTIYPDRLPARNGHGDPGITVVLDVDAGEHGIVSIPVTIGRDTDLISLGTVELRRIGGKER